MLSELGGTVERYRVLFLVDGMAEQNSLEGGAQSFSLITSTGVLVAAISFWLTPRSSSRPARLWA